jgi:type II secretory pathway pseudopilin PulG
MKHRNQAAFTLRHKWATSGFTMVEVLCSATILVLFVSAIFSVNQRVLASLKAQKETLAATQTFQERVEQLRSSAFSNTVDINWLGANIYNADAQSIGALGSSAKETVILSIYPTPDGTTSQLHRQNGTATVDSTSATVPAATLVRVDLQLTWTSSSGRSRLRRTSTVFGKGNIAP